MFIPSFVVQDFAMNFCIVKPGEVVCLLVGCSVDLYLNLSYSRSVVAFSVLSFRLKLLIYELL
jgi:hypothetical protein